jgi:hypothetical protein
MGQARAFSSDSGTAQATGGDRARWTKSSTARLEEGGNGVLLGLPVHITAHIRRRDVVWQARRPAML